MKTTVFYQIFLLLSTPRLWGRTPWKVPSAIAASSPPRSTPVCPPLTILNFMTTHHLPQVFPILGKNKIMPRNNLPNRKNEINDTLRYYSGRDIYPCEASMGYDPMENHGCAPAAHCITSTATVRPGSALSRSALLIATSIPLCPAFM